MPNIYLTDKQSRLLGWLETNPVPTITVQRHPSELSARAKWLKDYAFQCDELLSGVARDTSGHVSVDMAEFGSVFQTALDEQTSIVAELNSTAADLDEDIRERAMENA